ncbi:Small GTPase superfamily [Trypanosoma melophagium]|uniref:Small GTPase superfamily n=1 Tax=Trypanosoma melophagium TaxID=715481 RepID=UPI003519F1BE|nr:Small GTPase superfamily [Trypanosoma melophagium]
MGSLFSSLWEFFSPTRPYKLLILGLNNAGKTSILYQLQLGHAISTQPTLGGNTEQLIITHGSNGNTIQVNCWDLGGQEQLRDSWRLYYDHTDAVIFVVDAADPLRLPTAGKVLRGLLNDEPQLRQAILLVLANKQDLQVAATPAEKIKALNLGAVKDRTWTSMGCSASTGESLREAMAWVAQKVTEQESTATV